MAAGAGPWPAFCPPPASPCMPTSCSSWSRHRAASAGRRCTCQSTASPPSAQPLSSRCCCWTLSCTPASLGTLTRYGGVVVGMGCTCACEQARRDAYMHSRSSCCGSMHTIFCHISLPTQSTAAFSVYSLVWKLLCLSNLGGQAV